MFLLFSFPGKGAHVTSYVTPAKFAKSLRLRRHLSELFMANGDPRYGSQRYFGVKAKAAEMTKILEPGDRKGSQESGARGRVVRLKLSPCRGDVPSGCQNQFPATCSSQKALGHQEAVSLMSDLHPGFLMCSPSCLDFSGFLSNVSQVWVSFCLYQAKLNPRSEDPTKCTLFFGVSQGVPRSYFCSLHLCFYKFTMETRGSRFQQGLC